MNRMHKPDPILGPDKRNRRSVAIRETGNLDAWSHATVDQTKALIRLASVDVFDVGAVSASD